MGILLDYVFYPNQAINKLRWNIHVYTIPIVNSPFILNFDVWVNYTREGQGHIATLYFGLRVIGILFHFTNVNTETHRLVYNYNSQIFKRQLNSILILVYINFKI